MYQRGGVKMYQSPGLSFVNGGKKMYQRGGVKMYQSPGLSLSP